LGNFAPIKVAMPKRLSIIALSLIALITLASVYFMTQLTFDYDFEKFFPQNNPNTAYFEEHRKTFESDNDFVLIGIYNEKGIFQKDFLQQLDALTESLNKVQRITNVQSPTNLRFNMVEPLFRTVTKVPYIHVNDPERYYNDSIRIYKSEELIGNHFSADGKAVGFVLKTTEYLSKEDCDSLTAAIESAVSNFEFDQVHYAGRVFGQSYYVDLMKNEFGMFLGLSFMLVILFLWIAFRSFWGVIVPLTAVVLTNIWILGFMGMTGKPVDLMLTIMPTIMFVVGMSDVVHIYSKYIEELRAGKEKIAAIKVAFKEVGMATFLTSLTTAIGFITLISSGVLPIMDFGIYTAVGVFMAFIIAFGLLPAVFVLIKEPKIAKRKTSDKLFWDRILRVLFIKVMRNRKLILGISAVAVLLCVFGIKEVKVDNKVLEGLRDDDPLKIEFAFFDSTFSGARPYELALVLQDSNKSIFDHDVITKTYEIEQFLKQNYNIGVIGSPVLAVKKVHQTLKENSFNYYSIPEDSAYYNKVLLPKVKKMFKDKLSMVVTPDERVQRLSSNMSDVGAYEVRKLNARWDSFFYANNYDAVFEYHITGTAHLIDLNNEYLSENMLFGLLIAFGVIALIVGFMYRSLPMVLISLVPNTLPLIVVGGLMGLTGIDLKVSTSIIFTIVFGIAVDDTIHFMSKLKLELSKGKSLLYAMKRTYLSTGKAIVITSIILCGGFLLLIFSNFMGTFYIGFLLSSALALAVIADLLLLPVLISYFFGRKYRAEYLKQEKLKSDQ